MGLRFIIGGAGAGKSYTACQEIIEQSIQEPNTNFLVIVPDQFTMQTQKDLVQMHPNRGIMNIDVLSFGRLAHRIFDDSTVNRVILDDTGKSLVLRLIAGKCADRLQVVGGNLNKIGYIHELKSAISEFMQYGIGQQELEEMISFCASRKALRYKLEDLKVLYQEFTDYIAEKYITTEETMEVLASMIPQSKLIRNSVILLDGFTGFTPVQNAVLRELMCAAKELDVTILAGADENVYELQEENGLFFLSQKTVRSLCRIAQENQVERLEDIVLTEKPVYRHRENAELGFLEQRLFRYGKAPYAGEVHNIHLIETPNPKEEVRKLCREIKQCIREKNMCYRDIAVITGDLSTYAYHVEEEFAKQQIPYFLDQTRGIILNPFTEYIRSGLQIVMKNFSYETVFHFLRSGLTELSTEEIDHMENYCLALGLRGKRQWSSLFTRHTKETGEDAEILEALNAGREKLLAALEPILVKQENAGGYVKALYEFIAKGELEAKLAVFEQKFEAEGDYARAKEYGQIYKLVMQLLEQIYSLLENEKMSLQEFADILDAGLGEIEVGLIPQNVDRVVVGDMERTRLRDIKVLFCIGVNDGIIPKSAGNGGIISDIDRELLSQADWELAPSPRQQMYIQRLYLYMNLTKPRNELYLSYSTVDLGGKGIRPSYLVESFKKMYPLLATERVQAGNPIDEITTLEEGRQALSELLRDYATGALRDNEEGNMALLTLMQLVNSTDSKGMERLLNAAFYIHRDARLSHAIAEALYGRVLENSVSRLEKYAACAFSHFLQYGLHLEEREEYTFETRDMGNLFHTILETFSQYLRKTEYSWFNFPQEEGRRILSEAIESCAAEYSASILYSSERNKYIVNRLHRILERTVFSLQRQLKRGAFQPESYELSFSQMEDLDAVSIHLSEEERMHLRGRIDRVDVCEQDDKVYVKVIDYKSGNRDFDLVAVYHGLSLQLVVYLNAAMEAEKRKYPEKEVVPAALLYYKVEDPLIPRIEGEQPDISEINEKIMENLAMTGVVNDDKGIIELLDNKIEEQSTVIPVGYTKSGALKASSKVLSTQDFHTVSDYVNLKIQEIGREILDGKIDLNPYEMGGQEACTFCSYQGVCGFDEKIEGCSKQTKEKQDKLDILVRMREKTDPGNEKTDPEKETTDPGIELNETDTGIDQTVIREGE